MSNHVHTQNADAALIARMHQMRLENDASGAGSARMTQSQTAVLQGVPRGNQHLNQMQMENHYVPVATNIAPGNVMIMNDPRIYEKYQNQMLVASGRKPGDIAHVGYYRVNNSPTHSLGGSSAHSGGGGSPRASGIQQTSQYYDPRYQAVYENIDYYPPVQPQHIDALMYERKFESNNIKAQPQVPVGSALAHASSNGNAGRYAHTPQPPELLEQPPIYENVQAASGQQAQPQASKGSAQIYYHRNETSSPQIPYHQQYHAGELPIYESTVVNSGANAKYASAGQGTYHHSPTGSNISVKIAQQPQPVHLPNLKYHATGISTSVAFPYENQKSPKHPIAPSLVGLICLLFSITLNKNVILQPPKSADVLKTQQAKNKSPSRSSSISGSSSLNKSIVEDINGSDYVCMTGGSKYQQQSQYSVSPQPPSAQTTKSSLTSPPAAVAQTLSPGAGGGGDASHERLYASLRELDPKMNAVGKPPTIMTTTSSMASKPNSAQNSFSGPQSAIAGNSLPSAVSPTPSQLSTGSGSGKRECRVE